MPKHKLSISEARKDFFHLPEQFEEQPEGITITHHDKPIVAILPINTYRLLLETIESLQKTLEEKKPTQVGLPDLDTQNS